MWRSAVQVCLGLRAEGGLAQLARAPALQAGGQRFESVILHEMAVVSVTVMVIVTVRVMVIVMVIVAVAKRSLTC